MSKMPTEDGRVSSKINSPNQKAPEDMENEKDLESSGLDVQNNATMDGDVKSKRMKGIISKAIIALNKGGGVVERLNERQEKVTNDTMKSPEINPETGKFRLMDTKHPSKGFTPLDDSEDAKATWEPISGIAVSGEKKPAPNTIMNVAKPVGQKKIKEQWERGQKGATKAHNRKAGSRVLATNKLTRAANPERTKQQNWRNTKRDLRSKFDLSTKEGREAYKRAKWDAAKEEAPLKTDSRGIPINTDKVYEGEDEEEVSDPLKGDTSKLKPKDKEPKRQDIMSQWRAAGKEERNVSEQEGKEVATEFLTEDSADEADERAKANRLARERADAYAQQGQGPRDYNVAPEDSTKDENTARLTPKLPVDKEKAERDQKIQDMASKSLAVKQKNYQQAMQNYRDTKGNVIPDKGYIDPKTKERVSGYDDFSTFLELFRQENNGSLDPFVSLVFGPMKFGPQPKMPKFGSGKSPIESMMRQWGTHPVLDDGVRKGYVSHVLNKVPGMKDFKFPDKWRNQRWQLVKRGKGGRGYEPVKIDGESFTSDDLKLQYKTKVWSPNDDRLEELMFANNLDSIIPELDPKGKYFFVPTGAEEENRLNVQPNTIPGVTQENDAVKQRAVMSNRLPGSAFYGGEPSPQIGEGEVRGTQGKTFTPPGQPGYTKDFRPEYVDELENIAHYIEMNPFGDKMAMDLMELLQSKGAQPGPKLKDPATYFEYNNRNLPVAGAYPEFDNQTWIGADNKPQDMYLPRPRPGFKWNRQDAEVAGSRPTFTFGVEGEKPAWYADEEAKKVYNAQKLALSDELPQMQPAKAPSNVRSTTQVPGNVRTAEEPEPEAAPPVARPSFNVRTPESVSQERKEKEEKFTNVRTAGKSHTKEKREKVKKKSEGKAKDEKEDDDSESKKKVKDKKKKFSNVREAAKSHAK